MNLPTSSPQEGLAEMLRKLKLPSFASCYEEFSRNAERAGNSFAQYLHQLAAQELTDRESRKRDRLMKASHLPREKTLDTLELEKLPAKIRRQLPSLCDGAFVGQATNLLAFGLPELPT